jgi:phage recombination protein Bet
MPLNHDLALANEQKFRVIKNTLYPGSSDAEAQMVLDYCSARKIDPMLKPVHLVPMSVKTDKKDKANKAIYEFRSVVMPGIGLYRIDAARTNQYAGISEPEFGEDITEMVGAIKITYPKWCRVIVKRLMSNGTIVEFSAKEFWKENYATKSRDDSSPNAMWSKRVYAQLAKCAEAQALRKAFPESVGNEPTFEEMEGKTFDVHEESKQAKKVIEVKAICIEDKKGNLEQDCEAFLDDIKNADTLDELQQIFDVVKKLNFKDQPGLLKKLIDAKDYRKSELSASKNNPTVDEFLAEFDAQTGVLK